MMRWKRRGGEGSLALDENEEYGGDERIPQFQECPESVGGLSSLRLNMKILGLWIFLVDGPRFNYEKRM